ncbi:MAG: D-aminoacyl-tRNA deacylase [Crocinitomicaceae bacterium]|nr:D-aminoacyl-tRNA deacylase [Crocinitomicaceae bacterium]
MRVLIQRAKDASVTIDDKINGAIDHGMVVLLGVGQDDDQSDANWLVQKIIGLRIFNDAEGKMNLSSADVNGKFLVISQFTLHASTKKGNRPSYINAAKPDVAIPLYEYFVEQLKLVSNSDVQTGEFGADMKVALINDGPVTIWIDSKNRD